MLSDATTGYPLNFFVSDGTLGGDTDEGQGQKVVSKLTSDIKGTGRVVVMDRYFTSVKLAKQMYENGLHLVGTLDSRRIGIPAQLRQVNVQEMGKLKLREIEKERREVEVRKKKDESQRKRNKVAPNGTSLKRTTFQPKVPSPSTAIDATIEDVLLFAHLDTQDPAEPSNEQKKFDSVLEQLKSRCESQGDGKIETKRVTCVEGSTCFLFSNYLTTVKYQKEDGRFVYMLSTYHHAPEVSTRHHDKPTITLFYNKKKVGVDLLVRFKVLIPFPVPS